MNNGKLLKINDLRINAGIPEKNRFLSYETNLSIVTSSCDDSHIACVMSNGDVYTFGYNYYGLLCFDRNSTSIPSLILGISGVCQVYCSLQNTLCLMPNGEVKIFGNI